jgi:hypothetical protein
MPIAQQVVGLAAAASQASRQAPASGDTALFAELSRDPGAWVSAATSIARETAATGVSVRVEGTPAADLEASRVDLSDGIEIQLSDSGTVCVLQASFTKSTGGQDLTLLAWTGPDCT